MVCQFGPTDDVHLALPSRDHHCFNPRKGRRLVASATRIAASPAVTAAFEMLRSDGRIEEMAVNDDAKIELLDAMFLAFNRHDAAAVVALMTDDCIFETAGGPDIHGTRHVGKVAVKAAFEQVWHAFPDVRWDEVRHFGCGERAVSQWVFRATRPDGARIEAQGCDLFTFRGGTVALKQAFRKDRPAQAG
jgi:ketosteroid isomerase-like protein